MFIRRGIVIAALFSVNAVLSSSGTYDENAMNMLADTVRRSIRSASEIEDCESFVPSLNNALAQLRTMEESFLRIHSREDDGREIISRLYDNLIRMIERYLTYHNADEPLAENLLKLVLDARSLGQQIGESLHTDIDMIVSVIGHVAATMRENAISKIEKMELATQFLEPLQQSLGDLRQLPPTDSNRAPLIDDMDIFVATMRKTTNDLKHSTKVHREVLLRDPRVKRVFDFFSSPTTRSYLYNIGEVGLMYIQTKREDNAKLARVLENTKASLENRLIHNSNNRELTRLIEESLGWFAGISGEGSNVFNVTELTRITGELTMMLRNPFTMQLRALLRCTSPNDIKYAIEFIRASLWDTISEIRKVRLSTEIQDAMKEYLRPRSSSATPESIVLMQYFAWAFQE